MKRLFIIFMFVFILIFINTIIVYGEEKKESNKFIMDQLETLDMNLLEETIQKINKETEDYLPKLDIKQFIHSIINGEKTFDPKEIVIGIIKYLFKEFVANSHLLAKLILLSIICAFLQNISSAFENNSVAKLANAVCYMIIMGIAIKSFSIAASVGIDAINDMVHFMQALLPILITLLVSTGGIGSSTILQPVIVASVEITSTLMKNVIIPILFFSAILSIVNNLSSQMHISKLSSLLKQICIILMGFILTIFTGIITIQGTAASTADGVAMQTARFAVDTFVPIVGSFISESVDTIMSYSLLLKNAVGSLGFFLLALIVITPLLKILSLILIYKVAAALIEPITENSLINCLENMSSTMTLLFATVLCVAIMFFMTMTTIISTGSINIMIR